MSEIASKRSKKKAEPPTSPAPADLLSAESVPSPVSTLTSEKAEALPPAIEETTQPAPPEENSSSTEETTSSTAAISAVLLPKDRDESAPSETSAAAMLAALDSTSAKQDVPADAPSAGALLRAAREAAGLSVDDIARSLKLASRQVQALEEENFAALPPPTFVRGFLRNYARLVNVDADAVLAALPLEGPQTISPTAFNIEVPIHSKSALPSYGEKVIGSQAWKWLLTLVVLAMVAGVFFFWPHLTTLFPARDAEQAAADTVAPSVAGEIEPQDGGNAQIVAPIIAPLSETDAADSTAATAVPASELAAPLPESAATAEPAPTMPASAATANVGAELMLRFSGNSWTEVRDGRGNVLYSALARNGDEKTLRGDPPLSLTIGNSDATVVTWRGADIDLKSRSRKGVARLTLE